MVLQSVRHGKMKQANSQKENEQRGSSNATYIAAPTLGGITSIAGIMHGSFKIHQGNAAPSDLVFNTIDMHAAEKQ